MMMQSEIGESLNVLLRSSERLRVKEVAEEELPVAENLPQEYEVRLVRPGGIVMEEEGEFRRLMSEEAYVVGQEMADYRDSKRTAVEFTKNRLDDEIEKVFSESFVNYYLQLEGPQSNLWLDVETIPQAIQEKLLEIRKLGGKNKINMNIGTINENQKNLDRCFKQLR
jgi:hypothetical protein